MKISLPSSGLIPALLATLFFAGCTEEPEAEPVEEKPVAVKVPKKAPPAIEEDSFAEEKKEPSRERPDFQNMSEEERRAAWQKRREEWENMSDEEREARIAEMRAEREQRIQEMDVNNDGALGKDEVDERMWGFISQADKNGDNKVTTEEREEARAEREADRMIRELAGEQPSDRRFGGGPGGRGGPGGGGPGGKGGKGGPGGGRGE
jgi:hypothetical protein